MKHSRIGAALAWPTLVLALFTVGCGQEQTGARQEENVGAQNGGRSSLPSKTSGRDSNAALNSTRRSEGTRGVQPKLEALDPATSSPTQIGSRDSTTQDSRDKPSVNLESDNQDSGQGRQGTLFWNDASRFGEISAEQGFFPRRTFDEELLREHGIRHVSGPRLDLYTDIASSPALDDLPRVFELAHAAWCEYFNIDPAMDLAWRMNAFVMADREKFIDSQLLPDDIPAFANGYCRDFELWMDEKATDYYLRHLALHEGTHGFMLTHISGNYPEWYFEGMAEFLGTHKLTEEGLTLGYYPDDISEMPMWGRVGLLREAYRAGRMHPWQLIMTQGLQRDGGETEFYAWVWGWCALMNGMDAYRDRFHDLYMLRNEPDFPTSLARKYSHEWQEVNDNWQVFVSEVEYGYDFQRNAIQFGAGKPLSEAQQEFQVDAANGWQSTGIQLEAGKTYEFTATGRYEMYREETQRPPVVWMSEPQGISIEYYNGSPVGILQAVLVSEDRDPAALSPFLNPMPVSTGGKETVSTTGTLYLRINDHPAKRADNSGAAQFSIREVD
ncbi:MAG: hypothetical protein MPJ50_18765 [Pirellulales bacterium]|nr:hypothetical protein [Pirellulales bacterium]